MRHDDLGVGEAVAADDAVAGQEPDEHDRPAEVDQRAELERGFFGEHRDREAERHPDQQRQAEAGHENQVGAPRSYRELLRARGARQRLGHHHRIGKRPSRRERSQ